MCKSIVTEIKDSQILTYHFTVQSSRKKCGQICCLKIPVPTKEDKSYTNNHLHLLLLESCLQTCMTYTSAECTGTGKGKTLP